MKGNAENFEFSIEKKPDGIYVKAELNSNVYKLDAYDFFEMIEQYGISDLDKMNIDLFIKSRLSEIKISDAENLPTVNEKLVVDFRDNDMLAVMRFLPPINGGANFEGSQILLALRDAGVTFGIDNALVERLSQYREYFIPYEVANGKPATNGIDGKLEFFFDTKKKGSKPKMMDNGTVDYMNLDLIQKTSTGKELVKVIEPTAGFNGMDVRGVTIYAKPGKPAAKLPRGKNVVSSDDELSLFSGIDGQIQFDNNKVSVLPILEINSDVDLSTGNIDFNGAVLIKGGVRENFSVIARGVIEISGTVEGAKIHSDSDIFLYSGVMGANKATIYAGGNLVTKFVDSATIKVNGNISADSIMHSYVECNGEIVLEGKNGLLVGGEIWAVDKIVANEIGSSMATKTDITIGKTPSLGETGDQLFKQVDEIKFKMQKLDKIIDTLKGLGNNIQPEQKALLLKSNHTKILLATEHRKLLREIEDINGKMAAKRAKLSVKSLIRPGVFLTMGSARKKFESPVTYATFVNRNGNIEEVPFSE